MGLLLDITSDDEDQVDQCQGWGWVWLARVLRMLWRCLEAGVDMSWSGHEVWAEAGGELPATSSHWQHTALTNEFYLDRQRYVQSQTANKGWKYHIMPTKICKCNTFSHEFSVDISDRYYYIMNKVKPTGIWTCKTPANFQFNVQIIEIQHKEMTIFYGTISEILRPPARALLQVEEATEKGNIRR